MRVVALGVDLQHLHRLGDAGVVDQHVDPAELRDHLVDGRLAGRLVGDVAGVAAMRVAEFARGSRRGVAVEVENDRPAAVQREEPRRGPADTACRGRTSDNADLVCEKHRCFPPLSD